MKTIIYIISSLFLINCATTSVKKTNPIPKVTYTKKPPYTKPKSAITNESKKEITKTVKPTLKPYYYSILIDRFSTKKEADTLLNEFKKNFPLLPVKIRYETPKYKVYTGIYNTEKEADKAAIKLRSKYEGAFSVQFKNKTN